jgi:hypothetical protein
MEPKFNIADMANILKERKQTQTATALFLGAKAGGLFRSLQLYSTLGSFGLSDLQSLTPLERYHRCYNILFDFHFSLQDIHDILTDKVLLQEIRAEIPELCIAELMKQGHFNPLLSVSIYREFEEAFQQMGMKEQLDFAVTWPKSDASKSYVHSEKNNIFTLIKFFGDIASKDYSINRRDEYIEEDKEIKRAINSLRDIDILIVGEDQVWDQHVIQSLFPHSTGSVWYVNDEEPAKDSALSDYLKDCDAKFILGADGHYENFFRSLCWHITGAVPTYQAGWEALEKVKKELGENQSAIRKLADEIGGLREEIRGLHSDLRQFLASSLALGRTRKANETSKNVEEK